MGQADIRHELVTRLFDLDKDYAIIKKWWKLHGSFAPKPEHLSSTGIIIEADNPCCAGWLYNTDSKICVFEFVISNPEINKELRNASLTLLIERIKELASNRGYKLIYSSVKDDRYVKRLIDAGFAVVDKGQVHCFSEV